MYVTKLSKKGQTTIPASIREELGIEAEGEVLWLREGGKVTLKPYGHARDPLEVLRREPIRTGKTAKELCDDAEGEFW